MYGKPHFEIYTALMVINLPMANFMVLLRVGRQISRSSSATINKEFLHYQQYFHILKNVIFITMIR